MSHLKVLLAVEDNGLSLDLPVLDVHLVARQHDGDVLANSAVKNFEIPIYHTLQDHTPH